MAKPQVDVVEGMRNVTLFVELKRTTELRWRVWLATKLIFLAALLMNCNVDISSRDDSV